MTGKTINEVIFRLTKKFIFLLKQITMNIGPNNYISKLFFTKGAAGNVQLGLMDRVQYAMKYDQP